MMNSLWKWMIARRHDDGRPLGAFLARRVERSTELRLFHERLETLGASLRAGARRAVGPEARTGGMRRRVVAAIHASPARAASPIVHALWRMSLVGAALGAAAVIVMMVIVMPRTPAIDPGLAGGGSVLDRIVADAGRVGRELRSAEAKDVGAAPLLREAKLLESDARRAVNAVLARLPRKLPG